MMRAPLLLAACLVSITSSAMAQGKPGGAGRGPTPVIVASAYKDHFVDKVEAIGTLRANETITLASTVTETVTAVNFTDGQRVQKGDVLVEMTDGEEKALLDQQRALVNEAQKQLNRAKELAKTGAISKEILEQRQREAASTRAGLDALASRLADYVIVAPFDGIVGLRNISVGALLQPATKITTLDDDSVMKLDFSVPSVYLPTLKPGVAIVAKATGFNEEFKGEISAIDSQIDEATRSVIVRAIIPNPEAKLKPGLLMSVELMKSPRDAVSIPENAIVPEGRKHFVFVVDETKSPLSVEKREITIGTRRPGDVEVVDGLKEGEKVVVQGTMMVNSGSIVSITTEQKKGESVADMLKRLKDEKAPAQPEKK
jgi:membrane fusion protein (multidrug efflux system)